MCVPATTCRNALREADFFWPNRNRASDGICGDEAHQARKSDHNQGNAFDLTHDPFHGLDTHALARMLAEAKDPRVKYIISNRQIWSKRLGVWKWRSYTGSNPHIKHMHVSIYETARNSREGWWGRFMPTELPEEELTPEQHKMLENANHVATVEFPKLKQNVIEIEKLVREIHTKVTK